MVKECFAKLVCDKTKNNRVVGFHIVGVEAGEITQGYATALRYDVNGPYLELIDR